VILKITDRDELSLLTGTTDAFVPVNTWWRTGPNTVELEMPRLIEATAADDPYPPLKHGLETLAQFLWSQDDLTPHLGWREKLLSHLIRIRCTSGVRHLVEKDLPEAPDRQCRIHGDATLANLLFDSQRMRWVWCDPLRRPYIPGDPLVDLGKMFQSCWGYERVLIEDATPSLDEQMADRLANIAGLNYDDAMRWCHVHIVRLLPYQTRHVADRFVEVLTDVGL
jgi:hypothetical protein